MKLNVVYQFTHDSVLLGEDGQVELDYFSK